MAKQQSGETKAPLVVALAFFVLTTLILGVLTYMAFDEKAKLRDDAKKSAQERDDAKSKLTEEQAKNLMYKLAIGTGSEADFDNLKNGGKDQVAKQEFAAMWEAIKNRLEAVKVKEAKNFIGTGKQFTVSPDQVVNWPWTDRLEKPPVTPMIDAIALSYARQQLAAARLEREAKEMEDAKKVYQDGLARAQKAEADFKALSAEFPKRVEEVQKKADELIAATRNTFAGDTAKYQKTMKEASEQLELSKIKLDEALRKSQGLANQVKAAEEREEVTVDPFRYDKPHGKIISKQGNIVNIDLGSADNVRPGLTFSVQPSDTPERGLQTRMRPRMGPNGKPVMEGTHQVMEVHPKGTIEVVEVLGAHLSQARITSNPDPIREAILTGDVLYNPAWRKGAPDHVALFGVFDVDGDGTDDIKRVVQDLTRMGVVVDAYFDLETRKWVGQVTEQTNFAVEGYFPMQTGGDPLSVAKSALDQTLRDARNQAKEKGVKVVKARDFFPRIGYRIRLDVSPDTINRAYNRYLQTLTPGSEGTPPGGETTAK
jgi:hypothetical protein